MKTIDFCVRSEGGRNLWGTLTVPEILQGPAIVMAHGYLGFKDWSFFPWVAQFLAQAGFPVIRFNFSGSGMGEKKEGPFEDLEAFREDTISKQVQDLRSVIRMAAAGQVDSSLNAQETILLWGHSRGGAVCFLAASSSPQVKAIVTWSTIARVNRYLYELKRAWRKQGFTAFESSRTGQWLQYSTAFLEDAESWGQQGDVPTFVYHLKIPILLLHGSQDDSVLPDESESLAAIYPQSRLVILAGANHKFNSDHPFTKPSRELSQAAQKTLDFYQELQSKAFR